MSIHRSRWVLGGLAGIMSLTVISAGVTAQSPAASPAPSVARGRERRPVASVAPQLDVNTASQADIAAAFTAAGIPNADRWAQEVVEYRPYEADPTWARLRQELGKYDIDPAVLEQIILVIDGIPDASPVASILPIASPAALIQVNTATQAEIAAAFTVAGIPNADRWAQEVVEYRPYEADPTWARLRQELGKYNIDPAVLEQILAMLQV